MKKEILSQSHLLLNLLTQKYSLSGEVSNSPYAVITFTVRSSTISSGTYEKYRVLFSFSIP